MTSKSSFSKVPFGYHVLDSLRRSVWLPVLTLLVFFFAMPVAMLLELQPLKSRTWATDLLREEWITRQLESFFSTDYLLVPVILFIALLVSAAVFFAYIHKKRSVDFFHGLPIRRGRLFCIRYLAGFLAVTVPYLIMLAVTVLLLVCLGHGALIPWGTLFATIGINLLFTLCLYTVCVTAQQIGGTAATAFLLSGVMVVWASGTAALMREYCSLFYSTYLSYFSLSDDLLIRLSPAVRFFSLIDTPLGWVEAAVYLAATLLLFLAALRLHRRRPSEGAGHAVVFPAAKPLILYPLALVAAMVGGLFFHSVENGPYANGSSNPFAGCGWMIFGIIAGAVIAHCVLQVIFAFDFKRVFRHAHWMAVFVVVCLVLLCVPAFDLLGFETYLPNPAAVESAECVIRNLDEYAQVPSLYRLSQNIQPGKPFLYRNAAEVGAIHRLAQAGIDRAEDLRTLRYGNITEDGTLYVELTVLWKLRSGRVVGREYYVPVEACLDDLAILYDSESYKNAYYPLLRYQTENADRVQLTDGFTGLTGYEEDILSSRTAEERRKLVEALRRDLQAHTLEDYRTAVPLYVCSITFAEKEDDLSAFGYEYARDDNYYYSTKVPVYDSFEHTLKLLRSWGFTPGAAPDPENIRSASVTVHLVPKELPVDGYDYDYAVYSGIDYAYEDPIVLAEKYGYDSPAVIFTERSDIEALLENIHSTDLIGWNGPFARPTAPLTVQLVGPMDSVNGVYFEDEVPEILRKLLENYHQ